MSEREPSTSTIEAIARVQARISSIGKHGEATEGGRYSFRRIDDVIAGLHPILADERVMIIPAGQEVVSFVQPVPGRKESWSAMTIRVTYELRCGDCPESPPVVVQGIGIGLDNGDKGPGKALSYAYKSAISQLFSIPTDDPAMDVEMTPDDPPMMVPPRVVEDLRIRSVALKDTPVAEAFRDEMIERGLLPDGRLPTSATTDAAQVWGRILYRFEERLTSEPFDIDDQGETA